MIKNKIRRHVLVLKVMFGISISAIGGFNVAMQFPKNEIAIGVSLAIAGGAGMACLPLINELIIETTYPVGTATSTGIVLTVSKIFGTILIALSTTIPFGSSADYPMSNCREGELQDLSWFLTIINSVVVIYYFLFVYLFRQVFRSLRTQIAGQRTLFLFFSCPYLRQQSTVTNN